MKIWKYLELSSSDEQWFCNGNCGWPFNFSDSIFDLSTSVHDDAGENDRVSPIRSPTRHSCGSLNGFPKCLLLMYEVFATRLKTFMHTLSLTDSFDLITLTETWLDEDFHDRELYLDGYNIFRPDRCGLGGASLLETKLHLPCVRPYDLEVDAEIVVCQLTTSKTRCLLLAIFYRPPNAGESFLESFKNSLEKASITGIADLVITSDCSFPCVD